RHHDEARPEKMAGRDELHGDTRRHFDRSLVPERLQVRERAERVDLGIQRERGIVLRVPMLVRLPRVFLLDAARIGKNELAQVGGPRRAEDATPIALRDQAWEIPDMIEM